MVGSVGGMECVWKVGGKCDEWWWGVWGWLWGVRAQTRCHDIKEIFDI